uniref:H/ACA ribonucleoprotein complex subunit 2 n=1 Tax=Elaeis guineensis var. tenera TaxID=51953 RepID=A0A8N4ESL5_ELAGV|nr:H/ACA ribonucleoprotein complex subunit 2-like protein [Elaeis guineensis]
MGSDSETESRSIKERRKLMALAPIAKPLAGKKLRKRTLKLVRRASESKCLKGGVKEVVKSIRRGQKGLCIIAGNISPIDVITHVPILCEEADIPYIFVPSKEGRISTKLEKSLVESRKSKLLETWSNVVVKTDLAAAGATKRPTCCVLILTKPTKGELELEVKEKLQSDYNQVVSDVAEL